MDGQRRRMRTDSASEPPLSTSSYSSYNSSCLRHPSTQHTRAARRWTSRPSHLLRVRESLFWGTHKCSPPTGPNVYPPPYAADRRSTDGLPAPAHPLTRGAHRQVPTFACLPMLLTEGPPTDSLHPPTLSQEEDSLLATYLHPPMMLPPRTRATGG